MLVVMPFYPADVESAERNLEWAIELDGKVNHDCLLSVPRGTNVDPVLKLARQYFANVLDTFQYDDWKGPRDHFQAQNWAWQNLARHISERIRRPFFWWETDAVLTAKGAFDTLEAEWKASKQPFMGAIVLPTGHMNGCACYPWDVVRRSSRAMLCRQAPWDVVLKQDTIRSTHDASHLIQRMPETGRNGLSFASFHDFAVIARRSTVIFHGCKDDSLVRALRQQKNGGMMKPAVVEPVKCVEVEQSDDVGVVITTHNRPERLKRALASVFAAGFKDIVIAATGQFKPDFEIPKHVRIVHNTKDSNSNRAWLRGVVETSSPRTLILHDDDMVLPNYLEEVRKHLDAHYICYTARFHREVNKPSFLCVNPMCHEGELDSRIIRDHLQRAEALVITPVRGLFKRVDLIDWLTEAGKLLKGECYYRPDFLIGNDLWIWLRASTKYPTYYSMATPIVSLGCDSDSTTAHAFKQADTTEKLKRIYAITRDLFAKMQQTIAFEEKPHLHVITIVLDGAPFLISQLRTLNRLKLDWHWSIVEGVADTNKCTAWCKRIPARLSTDGTGDILADLERHERITVYRKELWPSKVDMVNAPLLDYKVPGIVMQVDVDELWDPEQMERIVQLFRSNPNASHAMFWCRYYVGPGLVMEGRNCFANNPTQEWRRAWNWKPGQLFLSHEPPVMSGPQDEFLSHKVTSNMGLVFDHYSYVLRSQVAFKERYYGYKDAVKQWEALQSAPSPSMSMLEWVKNPGTLRRIEKPKIVPRLAPVVTDHRVGPTPVSIVLPVKDDNPQFLREAWASITSQTHPMWELVLVDDSTDVKTIAEVQGISTDPRVRVVKGKRCGLPAALNLGIQNSSHELIARMDADDVMLPNRLQRQVEIFIRDSRMDVLGTGIQAFGVESWEKTHPSNVSLSHLLTCQWGHNHPSVMFRKSSVNAVGGYNPDTLASEDLDLWCRMAADGMRMVNVPEVLLRYRVHPDKKCLKEDRVSVNSAIIRNYGVPLKVGFITHLLAQGGAERWLCDVIRATSRIAKWTVVTEQKIDPVVLTQYAGLCEVLPIEQKEALDQCDVVISWCQFDNWRPKNPKRHALICHTGLSGFQQVRDLLKTYIVVNPAITSIGVSNESCQFLREIGFVDPVPIPLGLRANYYSHPLVNRETWRAENGAKGFCAGYMGRFSEEKNLPAIVKACSQIPVTLLAAGQTWPRLETKGYIQWVSGEANGHFKAVGWRNDVAEFMGACDVFVMASKTESASYTLLEAMASGTPCITTPVGYAAEHQDLLAATVTTAPESIRDAIAKYMDNPMDDHRRKKIAEDCLDIYSWKRFSDSWCNFLINMANR